MHRTLLIYECVTCGIGIYLKTADGETKVICKCGRYIKYVGSIIKDIRELSVKAGDSAFKMET